MHSSSTVLPAERQSQESHHRQSYSLQTCPLAGEAGVIEQGSRLSAVRLAQRHAACDVLGMRRGFDENDLYENLAWLTAQQSRIERKLFESNHTDHKPGLYLYDVTSSYLEVDHNAMAAFG